MKPSSTNRQLPGLSGIRGQPTASPELRFGWMQATIRLLSERKGGEFFLDIPSYRTSPLIGLIDDSERQQPHGRYTWDSSCMNVANLVSSCQPTIAACGGVTL